MRAKEIYNGLIDRWRGQCEDSDWIQSLKQDYEISDHEWTPDRFFLITVSWGPWNVGRQLQVWKNFMNSYEDVIEDIRNARKDFKGFPLNWQNDRVKSLAKNLSEERTDFMTLIDRLKPLSGIEARDHLSELCNVKQNKKIISCFVRDFLLKETFPIDTRVNEMLGCFGLPSDEDQVVRLCEKDGVSSRVLNRSKIIGSEY